MSIGQLCGALGHEFRVNNSFSNYASITCGVCGAYYETDFRGSKVVYSNNDWVCEFLDEGQIPEYILEMLHQALEEKE